MINFGEDLKNFSFVFEFQVQTGETSWDVSFGNRTGQLDYSGHNQIENLKIEKTLISESQNYLFVADYNDQTVTAYELINDQFTINNLITGVNLNNNAGFGYSVDGAFGSLSIGAPFDNQNSGQVFFYNQSVTNGIGVSGSNSFGQITQINGASQSGFFGSCISAAKFPGQDVVAISATGENNTGVVYLYQNDGLTFMKKIEPTGENINLFGKHVELFGIDAKKHIGISYEINQTGYIDIYKEDDFTQEFVLTQTIKSNDSHANNLFGNQIIFTNNKLFISSPQERNSGAVYQYDYNTDNGQFNNVKKFQETDVQVKIFLKKV